MGLYRATCPWDTVYKCDVCRVTCYSITLCVKDGLYHWYCDRCIPDDMVATIYEVKNTVSGSTYEYLSYRGLGTSPNITIRKL